MKILEYKNLDWMKGISAQANVPIGGLFQYIQGCDPFEPGAGGLAMPSLTPDNQTLGTTPKVITGFNNGGVATLNVLSDTKLYQVLKNSPYTKTDVTAQIDQHLTFGTPTHHLGAVVYQGMYVYATISSTSNGYISANSLDVASGNDVLIKDGYNTRDVMAFCVGADNNLYYNYGQGKVGQIISVAGTSGNSNTYNIDSGFTIRDLINDGRFLVIIADNNSNDSSTLVGGDFQIKVYFWDMKNTDTNGFIDCSSGAVWEIKDGYAIGGKFLDNAIYFFGSNGLYVTNVATQPKLIRPYPLTVSPGVYGRPLNPYQITASKGSIYWVDGTDTVNGYVYAYGNPVTGQQKIFYIPYVQNGSVLHTCLASIGNQFVTGTAQPGLYFFNVGSTRGRVVVKSIDTNMPQPFTFEYVKVTLGLPLATGQSVEVVATSAGNSNTISSETKSFSDANIGARQSFVFKRVLTGSNQQAQFEDIAVVVNSNGAPIQRVAVYATPLDDANEII